MCGFLNCLNLPLSSSSPLLKYSMSSYRPLILICLLHSYFAFSNNTNITYFLHFFISFCSVFVFVTWCGLIVNTRISFTSTLIPSILLMIICNKHFGVEKLYFPYFFNLSLYLFRKWYL